MPVQADGAGRRVVEAGHELRHGGLAGAGGADQRERLARGQPQAETVQDGSGVLGVVAELDLVELQRQGGGSPVVVRGRRLGQVERDGSGTLLDQRPLVDQLEHPLDAGPGLLADGDHHREHPDRAGHLCHVGGEGHEGTERDLAVHRQPAAEGQHRDLGERRDGLHGRVVPAGEPDRAQPGREQVAGGGLQLAQLLGLLPEALDHPDAADGLVHHSGDGRRLLLRGPGRREQPLAAELRDPPQRGAHHQGDQGERRRQPQHHQEGHHEHDQVAGHHRQHREQAVDQLEVRGRPADHLAGVEAVLAVAVQPPERPEEVAAQVVLDV